MTSRGVLWDFDGTLAVRPREWRGVLLEVLDEHEPGHGVAVDGLRLRSGFPWHTPETAHPHLNDADDWWRSVVPVIAAAYERNGLTRQRAAALAALVRERYVDPGIGWALVDGALPVLERLRAAGWRQAILSNHVPELPTLVRALGIAQYFRAVLTSAATGWDKPHPRMFELGRAALDDPDEIWMVGDNPAADVAGASSAGMRTILVQNPGRDALAGAVPLADVADLLAARSADAPEDQSAVAASSGAGSPRIDRASASPSSGPMVSPAAP